MLPYGVQAATELQTKVLDQAKQIQSTIKPGTIGSLAGKYTMKAKISGKAWVAALMIPPDAASRMIGYDEKQYIGLPYNKTQMVPGNKIIFAGGKSATGYSKTVDIFILPK